MNSTRREFLRQVMGVTVVSNSTVLSAGAASLHCTPSPSFPVPLTPGIWRSPTFPVGRHSYNIWLYVDRRLPLEQLDCDLGPPRSGKTCDAPLLLDIDWRIWNGTTLVKGWYADPVRADSWSDEMTGCLLGKFQGERNGHFTLEWNVKKDAGCLKELHPYVQIVKNPGYWCWL